MQNKFVIAALLGAVSSYNFDSVKHAINFHKDDMSKVIPSNIDPSAIKELEDTISKQKEAIKEFNEAGKELIEAETELLEKALSKKDKKPKHKKAIRSENDLKKLEQIVGGILKGALDAEGFGDITQCFEDTEEIFKDAEDLVKDFESDDTSKVINGIKIIAKMLKDIKSAVGDCKGIVMDLKKLEDMVEIFASPMSFVYHVGKDLLVNGVQIYHNISDAVTQYNNQNWEQFGIDIGEATAKTLLGEESLNQLGHSSDNIKLAQIEQGLLKAYGGDFDLYALLVCINEEDQALLMFDVAVQQFEAAIKDKDAKSTASDAIAGIIASIAGVQQFKQGIPACKAIDTDKFDYEKFDAAYDIAANPIEHFKTIEGDILLNGKSIKRDLRRALKGYWREDYVKFGYFLGEMLNLSTKVEVVEEKQHDRKMVAEVAQGFLAATHVGQFDFTALLECVYEVDQAAIALYEGVDLLEKAIKEKDMNEAVGGVMFTIAFLQQLKQSIPLCKSIDQGNLDWMYVDHIIDVAESPYKHMSVIENDVVFNGVEITKGLSFAFDAFRSQHYKDFGYQLGEVMYLATETPEKLDNMYIY